MREKQNMFLSERRYDGVEEVPWTLRQTLLGILFTLVPWLIFAFALSSLNAGVAREEPLTFNADLVNAIITFLVASLIEGAFLVAPLYFARRVYREQSARWHLTFQALGFRRFKVGRTLAWIIGLFFVILLLNVLYQLIITTFHLPIHTNDQVILERGRTAPITTYAILLASVLIAPLCEEVFFRGFVFTGFLQGMSAGLAVVLSALVFAVAHADTGSFIVLLSIGIALAFLRWRTRSLWPGIILHVLNNGLGALLILLEMQGILKM
jgi:membrane protease YdiL (CAAX protease family)